MKPEILDRNTPEDENRFHELSASEKVLHSVDTYASQVTELYAIEHPEQAFALGFKETCSAYVASLGDLSKLGRWVYFPWRGTIVHLLEDESFQKVRTARNRHLISEDEQKAFYSAVIGIAGLSVGNSVALAIVLQGGARHIKLADHDTLDLSNINRIRTAVADLGTEKVDMTAQQIYDLNPYAEVELFPDGLTESNISQFFEGLTIVIDEIDNLAVKMDIRVEAKKRKIPVLMAADNDKAGVLDIERHDQGVDIKPFHGRLGAITRVELAGLDKREIGRTIAQLVGIENHTERMLTSLLQMGKDIVSWPQLGGTALLNGALLAYCALKVANNQQVFDDRIIVDLDQILDPSFNTAKTLKKRTDAINGFKRILGV